jgi:hypothetical protein
MPDKCYTIQNLSAMPTEEINAAIAKLEIQQRHYETLLDKSIGSNEILAKTKVIYKELKSIAEELKELKKAIRLLD